METSSLSLIANPPADPLQLFLHLLKLGQFVYLPMNLATVDSEYGVLGRTVMYRGLTDDHITFITERDSRKYANIKENPKVSLTILLSKLDLEEGPSTWQIRIFGEAVELNPEQISKYWESEPIFAKIRSRICDTGKPVDPAELRQTHDTLLKAYQDGEDLLPQTKTFTGFKVVPKVWDFYKSEPSSIADRVIYKKQGTSGTPWTNYHVAA